MATEGDETGRVSGLREVVQLAWPLVLNNSIWTAQIFVDRTILARHDVNELAATLNSVLIFWSALNLFFFTTMYVSTFVSQYIGAGRPHRIGPVVGQAVYTALIGGVFFLGLMTFADRIFANIGAEEVRGFEATYFRLLCLSAMPTLLAAATNSFFIGRGDSRTVLYVSIVALFVNATLDFLLVFGRFGFPEMGIAGAGWATVAGQWVSACISMGLFLRKRYRIEYRTTDFWRFDPALFRRLLRFGVPNGVFVTLETGAFTCLTLVIGELGTREAAASTAALTLNMLAFLPAMGLGQTVEVLVGKYQGQDRPDLSEQRTYVGFALAWSFMAVMALFYLLIPEILLTPFNDNSSPEVIALATVILRFVAFYCMFDAGNSIFSCALRGAGDTRFVMLVVSFLPWLGMALPAFIAFRLGAGIYWLWGIASAYIATLAFVFYFRFRHGAWRTMKVIESADKPLSSDPDGGYPEAEGGSSERTRAAPGS